MTIEFFAIQGPPFLETRLPPGGVVIVGVYALAALFLLVRAHRDFSHLDTLRRAALFAVALLAVLPLAQVLVVRPDALVLAGGPGTALLGGLPVLVAAIWLGPGPAIVVGLLSGLGHAGWDTFRLAQPLEMALWAGVTSALVRQRYSGRVGGALRQPLVTATLCGLALAWPLALGAIVGAAPAGALAGLEQALSLAGPTLIATVGEAAIAGLLAQAALLAWPHLRPVSPTGLVSPPWRRRLNLRILYAVTPLITLAIVALVSAVALVAYRVATNLAIDQMARDAHAASEGVPLFVQVGQGLVFDLASDEALLSDDSDVRQARLDESSRGLPFFQQLIYVDAEGVPGNAFPGPDVLDEGLSDAEQSLVALALDGVRQSDSSLFALNDASPVAIIFVAPVIQPESGQSVGAVLGRATLEANPLMQPVVEVLRGVLVDTGEGFLIDDANTIILYPGQPERQLDTFELGTATELRSGNGQERVYRQVRSDGSQQLVHVQPVPEYDWSVVVTVPDQVVLAQAANIALPTLAILLAVSAVGLPIVVAVARRLTEPVEALAVAADRIATGHLDEPVLVAGEDEVGRLGLAFEDMRRGLKARLEEQKSLLAVSYQVSGSLDLHRALLPILDTALDATGALGVRVVLQRPDGQLEVHAEGDGAADMAPMDEELVAHADSQGELVVSRIERARDTLSSSARVPKVKALVALPLRSESVFQGVLWLAYDEEQHFEQSELNFLSSLANQASFAVTNARLFDAAEGGRRQLAAILASTSDAVLVTDGQRRLQLVNPAAERALKVRASDARGQDFEKVIKQPELLKLLGETGERTVADELSDEDGRTYLASASPIVGTEGGSPGRVVVLSDITYLKQLDDMKSSFVSAVSHDLRKPLTYMKGFADMLNMVGDLNEKQLEIVGRLRGGVDEMATLIEKLLNLGRIEAGAPLDLEACDVRGLLIACHDSLAELASAKNLDFALDLPDDLPHIAADTTLLRQAVLNLLDNAVKYAPEGESVTLGVESGPDTLTIVVRDTGSGIRREAQPKLFEPFFRAISPEQTTIKGSGLGLAIVKGTADRHGGRVYLESEPGKGSTFYLEMPLSLSVVEARP